MINAFQKAISVCRFITHAQIYQNEKEFGMACSLAYELGHDLKKLEKWDEASRYFLKSSDFAEQVLHNVSQMNALKESLECAIHTST